MEMKTVSFEIKEVDEETGIFTGYMAIFPRDPDQDGDIFRRDSFRKTLKEGSKRVRILFDPNIREPVGRPLVMTEEKKGLFLKGSLSLGVPRAHEALRLLRDGAITEIAMDFDAIKAPVIDGARHLQEVRLWDFILLPPAISPGVVSREARGAVEPPGAGDSFDLKEAEARIGAWLERIKRG